MTLGVSATPIMTCAAVIGSQSGDVITLTDGTTLNGDARYAATMYGILIPLPYTPKIDLGTGSILNITDPTGSVNSILIFGANGSLNADRLTINATGKHASALEVFGANNSLNLGTGSSAIVVSSADGYASGMMIRQSSLLADNLHISITGNHGVGLNISGYGSTANIGYGSLIETNGVDAHGVRVDNLVGEANGKHASLVADALSVITLADHSTAVNMQVNSRADLGSHSQLLTSGINSPGIWSVGGNLTADALTIKTTGLKSPAIEGRENSITTLGPGSVVVTANAGALVAMDDNVTLNFLGSEDNRNSISTTGLYGASAQSAGSTILLRNSDITVDHVRGMGLQSYEGGVINGDGLTITTSTDAYGVYAFSNGAVNLTGETVIDVGSPQGVALATPYVAGAPGIITATGKMDITGGVISVGGLIDLDFAPASRWYGSALIDSKDQGHLNVRLSDSEWRVAASSTLDNLQLDRAQVDLSAAADNAPGTTLTVANLSGSGDFTLRTDLVGDGDGVNNLSDKIMVTGSSAGSYGLTIKNRGSAVTRGDEVLTVVETPDGAATFTSNADVELGGYVYRVNKQGTNWVLASANIAPEEEVVPAPVPDDKAPEVTPVDPVTPPDKEDAAPIEPVTPPDEAEVTPIEPATPPDEAEVTPIEPATPPDEAEVTPVEPVTPSDKEEVAPPPPQEEAPAEQPAVTPPSNSKPTPVISTSASAGANFLNIGYLMNYAETQTLLQRMGDVRQGQRAGNVWLRGTGGRFDGFASGKLSQFSLNYSGYQFGVDKRLADEMPVYLGFFMGASHGSSGYQGGSGTMQSTYFGLYTTWISDAGFYLDSVTKINRLRNQFSVLDTQGNRVSGKGVSSGISASLEAGKRFSLSGRDGLFLEPQLQFTLAHQDNAAVHASNGLDIKLSDYRSLQARASVLAGYAISQPGYRLNAYLKTGAMREYAGHAAYALNGSREKLSFQGTGWNNGVGVSTQLRDHTLFMEADITDGSRFDQRLLNAGYRFSF
ncbi:autotransporter outer membrane beta-barrel domain-containing protein [Pantoea latae]|nr:autotransporter outer membrane beta-barrel domain-containing protein [Pantoea latae]